jgi:nitrogen-specific signal transduction histidine kinase
MQPDEAAQEAILFAPAGRSGKDVVSRQVAAVVTHPASTAVLEAFSGLVLVVNRERQVVAANTRVLQTLGVADPERILGLRPGEALGCIHAEAAPGGCGTGEACRTCGAVIAILACQDHGVPSEEECLLTARIGDADQCFEFRARAAPFECRGETFTVLSLRDVGAEKRRDHLERVFHHDLMNTLNGLVGASDCLGFATGEERGELIETMRHLIDRMVDEVRAHRDLYLAETGEYTATPQATTTGEVLGDLERVFASHGITRNRSLHIADETGGIGLETDRVLLGRVLHNMVMNALEASPEGGRIGVSCRRTNTGLRFEVWNQGEIPAAVRPRIFTRSFSTKPGRGRGLGTYGMRILGERCLGGRVSFTSDAEHGTAFRFDLPLS